MESIHEKKWIAAEIRLTYKSTVKASDRLKIDGSYDAEQLIRKYWDDDTLDFQEQFKIILLNRANNVLGIVDISTGGIAGTIADPKVMFGAALKAAASGMILVHNHPSGNIMPSQTDIDLTKKIKEGGKILDITVLDHLILTREKYYSFSDEGLM
jgi:DNA repair protein RadC